MLCLRNKFRSTAGMSILLALAVMLVCTLVASVVVMAAAANVGKGAGVVERNRAYYAVASAAQLLCDDFESQDASARVETTVKSYACQHIHGYAHDDAENVSEYELIFASNNPMTPFMQIMDQALRSIDPANPDYEFQDVYTIHAPDMCPVRVHFTMDGAYNMTVELYEVKDDSSLGFALSLNIPAVASDPEQTTRTDKTDAHMDGWEFTEEALSVPGRQTTLLNPITGNYEPESNEYGHSVQQLYDVTTTTTATQLSWAAPTLSKGVE